MRRTVLALSTVLAIVNVVPKPAAAVDLALVLLNDVSKSMDESEYALVKAGYRSAFADTDVMAALIGNGGGVAVPTWNSPVPRRSPWSGAGRC